MLQVTIAAWQSNEYVSFYIIDSTAVWKYWSRVSFRRNFRTTNFPKEVKVNAYLLIRQKLIKKIYQMTSQQAVQIKARACECNCGSQELDVWTKGMFGNVKCQKRNIHVLDEEVNIDWKLKFSKKHFQLGAISQSMLTIHFNFLFTICDEISMRQRTIHG